MTILLAKPVLLLYISCLKHFVYIVKLHLFLLTMSANYLVVLLFSVFDLALNNVCNDLSKVGVYKVKIELLLMRLSKALHCIRGYRC